MKSRQVLGCVAMLVTAGTCAVPAQASDIADAAMRSDVAAVRALIQKKADVNEPRLDGSTAIVWAVHHNHLEIADALVKAGADVRSPIERGVTPLSMAALQGSPAMVGLLLDAGADANARGPSGETMLMFAARNGNPEVIRLLVAAGADVNATERLRGTTALMWAVEQRHPDAVKALLAAGADHSLKSGPAGLPRNYMAPRVNTRAVEEAQQRRERARAAGRTYQEQVEWEAENGMSPGGRGRGRNNSPGGPILPGQGADAPPRTPQGQGGGTTQGAPAQNQSRTGSAQPSAAAERAAAAAAPAQPAAPNQQQPPGARQGGRGRGAGAGARGRGAGAGAAAQAPAAEGEQEPEDDPEVIVAGLVGSGGGGLTALVFAAREGDIESARALVEAGADVNLTTEYSWTPLLTAVNNRNYQLAAYLLENGADPNLANNGGWTPLYLATDNRNIEGGDYPVPLADMDHLALIEMLLEKGADPNAAIRENTLTRTIFTMQWFYEDGATPFIRAAQSSDTALMTLLLKYGADPLRKTAHGDTALTASAGIGWVDGVTYERSPAANVEAIRMLLDLGLDPNDANAEGRTPLMGAAAKGRSEVVQMLVDAGAELDRRDRGSRDTHIPGAVIAGITWQALDYADGLVRVGVQSAVARPETAALIRKLMQEKGFPVPPENRTIQSICITPICQGIP
jgi:ankyrin repeat protein